ncbi:MAG: sugar phosphate nucleotidyltransferase [Pseudanabaenaceae cyanobacterium]
MRAVLMAGGSGTRLRPLTCDLPKPMVPILNRPITEHILHLLRRHGIREVIATLHYLPDVMRDYFGDGSSLDMKIIYVVEEEQPLGTAGCVKNVESLVDGTFLVISGDSLTDFDLTGAILFHRQKHSQATLILRRVPEPMAFGVVITDENQRIQRFLEKPSSSEIFSDTVNTGIYILEPKVLEWLEAGKPSDFSHDLFPTLLKAGVPLYGYVAEGYWCDVGSLETYRQVQYDAIRGRVHLHINYPMVRTGVWVGKNTVIDPTVKIEAPVLIGDDCVIGAETTISAGTIIGDHVSIGAKCDLQRPIIGNGCIVEDGCHLWACTIAKNNRINRRAQLMEGAVIGVGCLVGEEAKVFPNVKIWPHKIIEAGATVTSNLIWGTTALRHLFGERGVSGLANADITPEFAVKLGAAYGACLKVGAHVMVSRDQRTICRMVTRSIISGLMSVGVHVENLEAVAIPIARFTAPSLDVQGGIHVRIHPDRSDHVLIEFIDRKGINIDKKQEKAIESVFCKDDFRRARIHEIGEINYPSRVLDYYNSGFAQNLDVEAIRSGNCKKVVIDYVYAVSGAVLPRILGKFGTDVVVLNASLNEVAPDASAREKMLEQLSNVVKAVNANFGAQIFANGEQFVLIDELGKPLRGESLTAVMLEMAFASFPNTTAIVPVHVSGVAEQIAQRHHGRILRTRANPNALMEACATTHNVVLGGSAQTGFIHPRLHPGFDAMFSVAKIMEWLSVQNRTLSEVRLSLPRFYTKHQPVRCPWSLKGTLMRHIVENYRQQKLDLTDGVKIMYSDEHWLLILPDAGEPLVHLVANGIDTNRCSGQRWVEEKLMEFSHHIESFCRIQTSMGLDASLLGDRYE